MSDSNAVSTAEQDLAAANEELAWELKKAAVDAAGLIDPTPISDGVGAAMSLSEGDFMGAGLSLISMVPYVGDAIGKTAKGARAAKKLAALRKKVADLIKKIDADKALKTRKSAEDAAAKARKGSSDSKPCVTGNCSVSKASGPSSLASKGHGNSKHGPNTTLKEQQERVQTGKTPGGGKPKKVGRATRFDSFEAQEEAIEKAIKKAPDPSKFPEGHELPPVIVNGRKGGYGSGFEVLRDSKSKPLPGRPTRPTGQDPNAEVWLIKKNGAWEPITQFPTNKSPTP